MGSRVCISLVEGRFEKLASEDKVDWDNLAKHDCGIGYNFSLCEPILRIESNGEFFDVEESSGWPSFHDKQLPGIGLYVVCTDAREHWFCQDDHGSGDTWFTCDELYSDMIANAIDPGAFSYSPDDCMWLYKGEKIMVGILSDIPPKKKLVVLRDNQPVVGPRDGNS